MKKHIIVPDGLSREHYRFNREGPWMKPTESMTVAWLQHIHRMMNLLTDGQKHAVQPSKKTRRKK